MEPAPSQTTLEIYKKAHDAADKFDYFVCTVTGAIFGYEAERFSPNRLDLDFHLLELVSILLLAAAFWCGLQKLRYSILGTRINHQLNDSEEKSLQLAQMLKQPEYQNELSQQMILADIRKHRTLVDISNAQLPKESAAARNYYIWRDILLVAGFLAIVAARIWQPYCVDSSAHATATAPPAQIQLPAAHLPDTPTSIQLPPAKAPTQAATNKKSQ